MTRLLALDVDGVLLPLDPLPESTEQLPFGVWGTSVEVLDALRSLHETVEFVWLTTWFQLADEHYRDHLGSFSFLPADWKDRGWWKATALMRFLEGRPDVDAVAWCDDHQRRFHRRTARVREFCEERGIHLLMICPNGSEGLGPCDVEQIREFLAGS